MRVIADIKSNSIIQVEKDPPIGESTSVSGKYHFYFPDGVFFPVSPNSVIVPYANPQSVVSKAFQEFLKTFPQFQNIVFNPLILDTDIDQINISGILNDGINTFSSRFQMGRGTLGPFPSGNAPNSVALLPENNSIVPSKPGVIVTNSFDVNPLTSNQGASNFAVYWRICEFSTTQDIRSFKGVFLNQNLPSIRSLVEIEQSPSNLEVYLSVDGGTTFNLVERLIPISFCSPGSNICLAFKSTSNVKRYLLSYAFLF